LQNPEWRSRLKKDPGVPNLFPYKNKILEEIEEARKEKEEDKLRRHEAAKARRLGTTVDINKSVDEEDEELLDLTDEDEDDVEEMDEDDGDDSNPMAALLASARARAAEYDKVGDDDNDEMDDGSDDGSWSGVSDSETHNQSSTKPDSSRKAFDKAFKSVIDSSDVVLYVLDARDPNGTRSRSIEQQIMADSSKRLILILNKIDLIPPPVLKAWLIHLRRSFPTLPLRAATPSGNAKTFDHKSPLLSAKGTSDCLFRALKTYAASSGLKRAISVGVIGYPNVGKSSVVNSLMSRLGGKGNSCPTGAEAGVTTSTREVKIDNKLKLVDSPGIVFPSSSGDAAQNKEEYKASLILLNAIAPKEITDPTSAVTLLLKRLTKTEESTKKLLDVYSLPPLMSQNGDVTTDFLVQVARKRGRLGKGGVPNLYAAAMTVLGDWWAGRISGWMEPPREEVEVAKKIDGTTETSGKDRKEIVTEWAKEFKLDGLWGDDNVDETSSGDVEMSAV